MRGASVETSISSSTEKKRAAMCGAVHTRASSLNHWCCSGVPPGMNWVVKNWRNAGFSLPQPISISLRMVSASSRCCGGESRLRKPRA